MVDNGGNLSSAELAVLMSLQRTECLTDSENRYQEFSATADEIYSSSDDWVRGDAWTHTLKNGTVTDTQNVVQVWKKTTTDIYLYIVKTIGSSTSQKFMLRIPKATNQAMLADLREQECAGLDSQHVDVSGSSSSMTAKETYDDAVSSTKTKTYDETYIFSASQLAWFSSEYRINRTITTKDENGDTVGTSTKLTSTFVQDTSPPDLPTDITVFTAYCTITDPGADVTYTDLNYKLPYEADTCETSYANAVGAGWDLTI